MTLCELLSILVISYAIIVGTVGPTMIVRTAVPIRVVLAAAKKCLFPQPLLDQVVPAMIVGTALPTINVLMAYYWKSCK